MPYISSQGIMAHIQVWRMYCIEQFVLCKDIPGDVAECGIGGGKTTLHLAQIIRDFKLQKKMYACDSFQGIPYEEKDSPKFVKGLYYSITPSQLLLEAHNLKFNNIVIPIIGLVENTLDKNLKDKTFCFVWIDLDLGRSTEYCIKFFENKINIGGILGFHDYKGKATPGVTKAIDTKLNKEKFIPIYHNNISIFFKRIK